MKITMYLVMKEKYVFNKGVRMEKTNLTLIKSTFIDSMEFKTELINNNLIKIETIESFLKRGGQIQYFSRNGAPENNIINLPVIKNKNINKDAA